MLGREMSRTLDHEKQKYDFIHSQSPEYSIKTFRYNLFDIKSEHFTEFGKLFVEKLLKAEKILDVGCGKGGFIKFFMERYDIPIEKFYGIDISEVAIQEFADNQNFKAASITDIPFDTGEFDVVLHFDGMEHIDPEWQDKALSELCRVSNKHLFLTIDMNKTVEDGRSLQQFNDPVHINLRPHKEWVNILKEYTPNIRSFVRNYTAMFYLEVGV